MSAFGSRKAAATKDEAVPREESGCKTFYKENCRERAYRTIGRQGKINEQELAGFLAKNGQGLLPMVDLIERCQVACDERIDVTGRAAIQAV
ncbi:MAG: hypothetical protein ACLGSH_02350 [Acidobacteriota bacterium]